MALSDLTYPESIPALSYGFLSLNTNDFEIPTFYRICIGQLEYG